MKYLLNLFLLLFPRLLIIFLKVLTDWFNNLFRGWFWIILGLILAPWTLLWYSVVQNWFYGIWGIWQIVILILAIIIDLFSLSRIGSFEE
ncbi:MAG: hypothetical protein ACK413_01600 [Patescibacteria group bacterium]